LRDLAIEPPRIHPDRQVPELNLRAHIQNGNITGSLQYRNDQYRTEAVQHFLQHFERILDAFAKSPDSSIRQINILTPYEEGQLRFEWNSTATPYRSELALHELFEEQVAKTPEAVALVYGEHSLTYGELNKQANQLARHLINRGAMPDTRVGICMDRSLQLVVSIIAVLKTGAAYVPLDPGYPAERLDHMLIDSQVNLVLIEEHLIDHLRCRQAHQVCADQARNEISRNCDSDLPRVSQAGDAAYIIYTSGSTGRPKGVVNTHLGICNRLLWMQDTYNLTQDDRVLQKTPFSFDVSLWEFFWPLITGARLVIAEPGKHGDPSYLSDIIRRARITTIHFVPSMFSVFLDHPSAQRCSSLVRIFCSGEVLSNRLVDRCFDSLPHAQLHNLYGPTEAAVDVTYWQCEKNTANVSVPIGKPIANTQIYILDRASQLAPVGVPGELNIGGAGLARCYWNRPALTAERFVPDPFSGREGSRLYRTGDWARRLASGDIEYLGRMDHQIKLRGFRIELGEIEAVLRQFPGTQETVVVVSGGEDVQAQRLIAYVIPSAGVYGPVIHCDSQQPPHHAQWQGGPEGFASIRPFRQHMQEFIQRSCGLKRPPTQVRPHFPEQSN
jgi:amino acid adenylation domain-containing protein